MKAQILMAEKDFKVYSTEHWNVVAEKLYKLQKEMQEMDLYAKMLKKELINLSAEKNTCGIDYYLQQEERRGLVDYKVIPELKDVDLEQYRKNKTVCWKIYKY